MTTFQGGTSPWESIAPYRLYLDANVTDVEFTGYRPSPEWIQSILGWTHQTPNTRPNQDQEHLPGEPYKPLVASAPPHRYASGNLEGFVVGRRGTMLRWLESQGDRFKSFLEFVRFYRLQNYLNAQDQSGGNMYTLFAPVDCTKLWAAARQGVLSPTQLLTFHMLAFTLLPVQLDHRVLRVETMMGDQVFTVDGRIPGRPEVRDGQAAINPNITPAVRNRILQAQNTDNGFVFVIEQSVLPARYW